MSPRPSPLGRFIKDLRRKKKVSLRKVQDATGISNAYLSQLETGARQTEKLPPPDVLRRLADYFNVSMLDMLQHTGYLNPSEAKEPLEDRINRAYEVVINHPKFKSGTRITGKPTLAMKRFIVEMFEKATGEKLLEPG